MISVKNFSNSNTSMNRPYGTESFLFLNLSAHESLLTDAVHKLLIEVTLDQVSAITIGKQPHLPEKSEKYEPKNQRKKISETQFSTPEVL